MAIEKIVTRKPLGSREDDDIAFWRAQTPKARLEALTAMVNAYYGLSNESSDRFQRVPTVTKRPLR